MKKLLAILFAAVLCIALGVTAWAATEVTVAGVELSLGEYLNESGTKVTSPTDNYAHFHTVGSEYVLTLKNYDYSVSSGAHHCITWSGDLVIELPAGTTSNVTNGYTATGTGGWGSDDTVAIQGEGNNTLTIKGPGSLNATGYMHAIWATSSITVTGGATVNATATIPADKDTNNASIALSTNRDGKITVDGANVTATGNVYGIGYSNNNSGTLIVTGDSNVTAKGGVKAILGDATLGGMIVTASTEVDGDLGEYEAAKLGTYKYVKIEKDETIKDYTIVLEKGVVYKNGTAEGNELLGTGITATGNATDGYTYTFNDVDFETTAYYGITVYDENAKIVLSGTNNVKGGLCGISFAKYLASVNVVISGEGTLNVIGGANNTNAANKNSYGIYVDGNLTVSGGTVNATGGDVADNESYGIYVKNSITVSGNANVIAEGGDADKSYGICAYSNNGNSESIAVNLSGLTTGKVIAKKGTVKTWGQALSSYGMFSRPTSWEYRTQDSGDYTPHTTESIGTLAGGDYFEIQGTVSTPTTYTVTLHANDGSSTTTDITGVSGSYDLPTCTFTAPEGKQFKGWATSAAGEVISETSITVNKDTDLHAIWEDIPVTTYIVSFDANGGSGTMNTVTVEAGEYTLPACTFTAPENGIFKGWATSKDGEVITGESITVSDNMTLYAQWSIGVGDDEDPDPKPETKPEACDHKFDANGKCSRCGVIVISYPRDEAEANPNTGAPVVNGFAAIAVLAAGAICLGKRK